MSNAQHSIARARARTRRTSDQRRGITAPFEYCEALRRDPCSYCGGPGGCVDHIAGRSGTAANLTGTCRRCNSSKQSQSVLTFLHKRRAHARYMVLTDETP